MDIDDLYTWIGNTYEFDHNGEYEVRITQNKHTNSFSYIEGDNITIEIDNDVCSIYCEYQILSEDTFYQEYKMIIKELKMIQYLYQSCGGSPSFDDGTGYDWPYQYKKVGYFDIPFDLDKSCKIITAFDDIFIYKELGNIDEALLMNSLPDVYEHYKIFMRKFDNALILGLGENYSHITEIDRHSVFSKDEPIYTNGFVVLGMGDCPTEKIRSITNDVPEKNLIKYYFGFEYFIGQLEEGFIYGDINRVLGARKFIEELGLSEAANLYLDDIYYKANNRLLFLESEEAWAIILMLRSHDSMLIKEKIKLKEMASELTHFLPVELRICDYKFDTLSPEDFEKLCSELLNDLKYTNIFIRGKTNSPDGGVDIEADIEASTFMGSEIQHRIFQCKRTDKVNLSILNDVIYLLEEFQAHGYGLFCSCILPLSFRNRAKTVSRVHNINIEVYDKNDINLLLINHPETANRYFLFR